MALNSKSGRGGKRPGAGRPEGSKNRTTLELRGAAQVYAQGALETSARGLHDRLVRGGARHGCLCNT